MKKGKATGPSGLNVEMILGGGNDIILAIAHLINCIIAENKIPDNCCLSYIINCYKGKGDALMRGNYRGLKLLDQVMKVMEHILATIIRTQVDIDAMQFGFMPGRGTTNAIFILRQVHEKYLGKHKDLYFAFADLEEPFDRVPRKVLLWALRKVGADESRHFRTGCPWELLYANDLVIIAETLSELLEKF